MLGALIVQRDSALGTWRTHMAKKNAKSMSNPVLLKPCINLTASFR